MAIENHYHNDATPANDSSAMTVIVALIAILFIIGLGLFALRSSGYSFGNAGAGTSPTRVNVDLNTGNGAGTTGAAGAQTNAPANP
jgi:hypothetical protein